MTLYPSPPDAQLAERTLEVLIRHRLVPAESGWRALVAPGGSTDRTFSVIDPTGEPRLTVRLARPGMADRLRHERQILNELADRSSPAPHDVTLIEDDALPERWLLAHTHMPGQPGPVAGVSTAAHERLGACLAWVHRHQRDGFVIWPALEVQYGTRADLYRARLETLRRYHAGQGALPDVVAMLDRLARVDLPGGAGWQESRFFLCHGDLSVGNILWDGDDVHLIDWEFARDGDAAEDIAYLIAEQDIPPSLVAEIAEAYVDAGGDPWAFARLSTWLPLVALDAALWWADYHLAQGANPLDQQDVTTRLKRAGRYLGR